MLNRTAAVNSFQGKKQVKIFFINIELLWKVINLHVRFMRAFKSQFEYNKKN